MNRYLFDHVVTWAGITINVVLAQRKRSAVGKSPPERVVNSATELLVCEWLQKHATVLHATVTALNAGPLNLHRHLRGLSRHFVEVVQRRPLSECTHVNHTSPEGLRVLSNKFSIPEYDTGQHWHDRQETVQGIQIDFAHHDSE